MKRRMGNPRAYLASFTLHKHDKKAKTDGCQTSEYKSQPNNTAVRSIDQGLKRTIKDKGIPIACASVNGNDKPSADCGATWRMKSSMNNAQHTESSLASEKHVELESGSELQIQKHSKPTEVCFQPGELSFTSMDSELEEGEIRVKSKDSSFHEDLTLRRKGQEACIGMSMNRNLSSYIQEIEKICARRMRDLMQQEIIENDKFKLFMENEKLKIEKNALKSNLSNSLIGHHYAKHGDLCPLSRQSPHELNGFDQYRLSQKRKLVHLQIAARNKEKNLKQKWMKDAYHGKLEVSSDTIPLPVHNFQAESFEDFSCWGEASGCSRNVTGSVILSDESNKVNSKSKDVLENNPDGHFRPLTGADIHFETSSSLHLSSSELQPAENSNVESPQLSVSKLQPAEIVNVEDPILSNLAGADIHFETSSSLRLSSSELQPAENLNVEFPQLSVSKLQPAEIVNVEDPNLSNLAGADIHFETSSSLHLSSSELQPAENLNVESPQLSVSKLQPAEIVNVEDPILSNLAGADIHLENALHDCLGITSNEREPCVPHPFMITTILQGHELCADPFQNEMLRVQKEVEIVNLMLEQKKLQLKLELDNAIEKLQEKYGTLVKDTEAEADSKIKSSKIIYDKLQKNQVLAEQFKANFYEKTVTVALQQ